MAVDNCVDEKEFGIKDSRLNGTVFTGPPKTMAESITQTTARWKHEYGLAIESGGVEIGADEIINYGCPVSSEGGILQKRRE